MVGRARGGRLFLGVLAACACACASDVTPASSQPNPYLIEISNFTDAPPQLSVPPGATVVVLNLDGVPHTVTSSSAPGTYAFGAVDGVAFDTGPFTQDGAFSIPSNAPVGTVIPYFCELHGQASAEAGTIVVAAP